MTSATAATPTTHTLEAPGATIVYDIREPESKTDAPALMLIGSPMDASGFVSLAGFFRDRRILTYDAWGRAQQADRRQEPVDPQEHGDDLSRVIAAAGGGPVDIFASSGGAVNAFELVTQHPEQVRTLVAHEPPSAAILPDRDDALAAAVDIHETYLRGGTGPGMAKFMALTMHKGPVPADFAKQPVDPAAFGLPTEDDGKRDDPLLAQNMIATTHYAPDFDALRRASTRIVVAVGEESEGELAHRGGEAAAERLGTKPVVFPSHHGGFLGGEFGWPGKPEEFAKKLREVLSQNG